MVKIFVSEKYSFTFASVFGAKISYQNFSQKGMPFNSATVPAAVSSKPTKGHTFATVTL
jgi:hypothetical protein